MRPAAEELRHHERGAEDGDGVGGDEDVGRDIEVRGSIGPAEHRGKPNRGRIAAALDLAEVGIVDVASPDRRVREGEQPLPRIVGRRPERAEEARSRDGREEPRRKARQRPREKPQPVNRGVRRRCSEFPSCIEHSGWNGVDRVDPRSRSEEPGPHLGLGELPRPPLKRAMLVSGCDQIVTSPPPRLDQDLRDRPRTGRVRARLSQGDGARIARGHTPAAELCHRCGSADQRRPSSRIAMRPSHIETTAWAWTTRNRPTRS